MAEISVIVPVYRAEKYLERCVRSVLAQSFRAFCLILVDDGSPDRCPALCDAYALEDPRVHVIHQANSGPSAARNHGISWALEQAGSKYLSFVDSDDCLHPQYLERLHAAAEAAGADLAMCRHKYFRSDSELLPVRPYETPVSAKVLRAEELVVQESKSFNYCWGKLFRSALFRELRFPENVSFGEDNLTIYKAFFAANKIVFFPEPSYYYFYSPTGITKMAWSPRSLECFQGIREQMDFYRSNGYDKAYRTEVRAYIQQFAYQIHRIRWDKVNRRRNQLYLHEMTAEMKRALKENEALELQDDGYWFEALHPHRAALRDLARRIRRRLRIRKVRT